jgi:rhodanese-related sulfurtransferase
MKKMMLLAVSALLLCAGCEEKKTEQVTEQPKPAAEQPAVVAKKAAPAPSEAAVRNGIKSIDWEQAIKMYEAGAVYVDVRNPPELQDGFAPFAINIPLNELKQRMNELPKDKDLLVYCRSGRRSELATNALMKAGFDRAYNVLGGFLAYPKK